MRGVHGRTRSDPVMEKGLVATGTHPYRPLGRRTDTPGDKSGKSQPKVGCAQGLSKARASFTPDRGRCLGQRCARQLCRLWRPQPGAPFNDPPWTTFWGALGTVDPALERDRAAGLPRGVFRPVPEGPVAIAAAALIAEAPGGEVRPLSGPDERADAQTGYGALRSALPSAVPCPRTGQVCAQGNSGAAARVVRMTSDS
jgi:hypothetical protein